MLGSLRGKVIAHHQNKTLIEVQSVGYWVYTGSLQLDLGQESLIFLYQNIREDASDLYGFASLAGLELFEHLISISGIGPKAGLAILALDTPENVLRAIDHENIAFLTAASGVGQKAAQKIILELKGKISNLVFNNELPPNSPEADLMAALEGLGYKKTDIAKIIHQIPEELVSEQELIKWALRELN